MHGGILFNEWYLMDTHNTNLEPKKASAKIVKVFKLLTMDF